MTDADENTMDTDVGIGTPFTVTVTTRVAAVLAFRVNVVLPLASVTAGALKVLLAALVVEATTTAPTLGVLVLVLESTVKVATAVLSAFTVKTSALNVEVTASVPSGRLVPRPARRPRHATLLTRTAPREDAWNGNLGAVFAICKTATSCTLSAWSHLRGAASRLDPTMRRGR